MDIGEFPIALIIMALYAGWCAIVLHNGIHETTPDVSQTFNLVGATLAFILPLIGARAVSRNKESLNNYNAFCGDVLALAWETLVYVRDEKANETEDNDKGKIQELFELCLVLPTFVKWKFRGNLDVRKVWLVKHAERDSTKKEIRKANSKDRRYSSIFNWENDANEKVFSLKPELLFENPEKQGEKFKRQFIVTSVGRRFNYLYVKVAEDTIKVNGDIIVVKKGIDECDLLFALLNKLISEFKTKGDTRKNMLTRTLERVYGSYGNMGNIDAYKLPSVYTVYLYISMALFMLLFPLNYDTKGDKLKAMNVTTDGDFEAMYSDEYSSVIDHEWNIIWHGVILIYFLFGFHFMTTRVGNAFKSSKNSPGYTTVGETETDTNKALLALYTAREDFQKDNLKSTAIKFKKDTRKIKTDDTAGAESKSKSLTNRRKLYI